MNYGAISPAALVALEELDAVEGDFQRARCKLLLVPSDIAHKLMSAHKPKLARDIPRRIDLRLSANLFQASLILVASLVGALVGYLAVVDERWIGAAGGGVLGMIVATFISGFVLMFFPQKIVTIELHAYIKKYRRIRRRLTILVSFYVVWAAVLLLALPFLAFPVTDTVIALLSLPMCVCYALQMYHVLVLDLWRCPSCNHLFRRRGPFARYPHYCDNCGYKVDRDGDVAA